MIWQRAHIKIVHQVTLLPTAYNHPNRQNNIAQHWSTVALLFWQFNNIFYLPERAVRWRCGRNRSTSDAAWRRWRVHNPTATESSPMRSTRRPLTWLLMEKVNKYANNWYSKDVTLLIWCAITVPHAEVFLLYAPIYIPTADILQSRTVLSIDSMVQAQ